MSRRIAISPPSPFSFDFGTRAREIDRDSFGVGILYRLRISKIHRWGWFRADLVIFRPSQRFPLLKIYEGRAHRGRAKQTVSIRKLFTITSSHRHLSLSLSRNNGGRALKQR